MRACICRGLLFCLLVACAGPVLAQSGALTFEGYLDGTILTNQFIGTTFSNAIILSAGITLNEFEFPPLGTNAASDNGGPMTVTFTRPVRGFAGYFTYGVPLTIQALGASNNVVASQNSPYSDNEAQSGASGSQPNELLQVTSGASIYKVVITGGAQGSSFTLDNAIVLTKCDLNLDGATNVTDAQRLVNEVLGVSQATDDLNADGVVNVVDLQILIDAALGMGCLAT
jgi:hypothetical protein